MPTFRKRSGSWQAIVNMGGHRQSKTFKTKQEARDWASDLEEKLVGNTQGGSSDTRTMHSILDMYRKEVVPTLADPKKDDSYIRFLMSFHWTKIPLNMLDGTILAEWRDLRYETCSAKTVDTNFTLFKTALNHAKADEAVMALFKNVKLKRVTGRMVPRFEKRDEEWLLEKASKSPGLYLVPIIQFALATGMRRGEMLKLEWSMVDFDRGWIHLPGRITKTGKDRTVPITYACRDALQRIKALREAGNAVFRMNPFFKQGEGVNRVWPVTADGLRKTFETARTNAGLEYLHWHDLRHEAISRFFDMGLSVPEVQSISGHSTPEELSRYSHASGASIQSKLGVVANA